MRLVFKPYKNGLNGLSLVREKLAELDVRTLELKKVGSRYRPRRNDFFINWGVPKSKPEQFRLFAQHEVQTIDSTSDINIAQQWIEQGEKVVCRTILNGHGGAGIVLAKTVAELVNAPLYTKYKRKQREFRVHVVGIQTYTTEKKRMAMERRPENYNKYIRNHDNGWVFCRQMDEPVPPLVLAEAAKAVAALGLQFGAVDIGYHDQDGIAVYEVNTAPGCDNETAMFYANALVRLAEEV